jgi:siderophore synthetase component
MVIPVWTAAGAARIRAGFDCIFRFLSPLLDREGLLAPSEFWSVVASSVRDCQAATPELAGTLENPLHCG